MRSRTGMIALGLLVLGMAAFQLRFVPELVSEPISLLIAIVGAIAMIGGAFAIAYRLAHYPSPAAALDRPEPEPPPPHDEASVDAIAEARWLDEGGHDTHPVVVTTADHHAPTA